MEYLAVVAVVVVDEVDLVGGHEHDVRQHTERAGLADHQVGAVVVGGHRRQNSAVAVAAAAAAAAGRRLAQSGEVVADVGERRVGADRKESGVELQFVAEPKQSGRRRRRNVHLAVAVLYHVHVAFQRPEEPDLLYLSTCGRRSETPIPFDFDSIAIRLSFDYRSTVYYTSQGKQGDSDVTRQSPLTARPRNRSVGLIDLL